MSLRRLYLCTFSCGLFHLYTLLFTAKEFNYVLIGFKFCFVFFLGGRGDGGEIVSSIINTSFVLIEKKRDYHRQWIKFQIHHHCLLLFLFWIIEEPIMAKPS